MFLRWKDTTPIIASSKRDHTKGKFGTNRTHWATPTALRDVKHIFISIFNLDMMIKSPVRIYKCSRHRSTKDSVLSDRDLIRWLLIVKLTGMMKILRVTRSLTNYSGFETDLSRWNSFKKVRDRQVCHQKAASIFELVWLKEWLYQFFTKLICVDFTSLRARGAYLSCDLFSTNRICKNELELLIRWKWALDRWALFAFNEI